MSRTGPTQPQDAFAELASITLADTGLDGVMGTIAALARTTVPGATEVSVTLLERGRPTTVAFTGPLAIHVDEQQYGRGSGPCLDSIAAGETVRIDSMATEARWPHFAEDARREGVGSSLSVPVPVQREVGAALNIYSTEAGAFDDASEELAQTFAAYAGVALANVHLYEAQARVAQQLQEGMRSRAVIEQAKGVLMAQHRCGPQHAFDLLVRRSQSSNRKLRDVAQTVVDDVDGSERTAPAAYGST